MPHVYAPDRNSAPNDLVPARARGLPEILTVIEQHKPEAQITDIRIPPTGRDEGIQAAAGCHWRSTSTSETQPTRHDQKAVSGRLRPEQPKAALSCAAGGPAIGNGPRNADAASTRWASN
jgi:hypothetical protein